VASLALPVSQTFLGFLDAFIFGFEIENIGCDILQFLISFTGEGVNVDVFIKAKER